MELISKLPREVQLNIYFFTDEFYRRYCRYHNMYILGEKNNTMFPQNLFSLGTDEKRLLDILKMEKRKCFIEKINTIMINHNIRPIMQCSRDPCLDFKGIIDPNQHMTFPPSAINNKQTLVSYCLKLVENNYTVLLIANIGDIVSEFLQRMDDHYVDRSLFKYYLSVEKVQSGSICLFENIDSLGIAAYSSDETDFYVVYPFELDLSIISMGSAPYKLY